MRDSRDMREYFERLASQARSQQEVVDIMRAYQRELERYTGFGDPYYGRGMPTMLPIPTEPAKEKPKKPLPEDHIVSAIIGFRAWNVPLFVDELRSVAKSSKWLPYAKFSAQCEAAQCSGVSCTCGIYAFNKLELVQKEYRQEDRSKRYVYGECWLWGRVLECEKGYRAQFAYPKAFVDNGAIAKRMAEIFGVELLATSKQEVSGLGPRSL